jgi:hypothetical protein
MASLADFMRQELVAIRAMEGLQKSLVGSLALDIPRITLPRDILGEASFHVMMREALAQQRMVSDVASRITEPLWSASDSIARLLESLGPGRELADQIAAVHRAWKPLLPPDTLRLANIPPLSIGAHLAAISRLTETSRMIASGIQPDTIGRALAVSAEVREGLLAGFEGLTNSYGRLYEEFAGSEQAILSRSPTVTARPAAQYFAAVDLVETTTCPDLEGEQRAEIEEVRSQVAAENAAALDECLAKRHDDLLVMVRGARGAFGSKHADYVRHFTTSLRELFTHVLHRLAPDAEVKKFSTNPDDFPGGKPTRSVRLRYICRDINSGRFTDFVKKDVAAMLAFVDLFQSGTHEVISTYTEPQLLALLSRMEGTIRFLLEIDGAS